MFFFEFQTWNKHIYFKKKKKNEQNLGAVIEFVSIHVPTMYPDEAHKKPGVLPRQHRAQGWGTTHGAMPKTQTLLQGGWGSSANQCATMPSSPRMLQE